MKKSKIICAICISITVITSFGFVLIWASVRNDKTEAILEQYKKNNPDYMAAVKKSEMIQNNTYGIEIRDLEASLSSNSVRIHNATEAYEIYLESGGADAVKDIAEELDGYMIDAALYKQRIAYNQMQQALSQVRTDYPDQGYNGEEDQLLFQQYCDYMSLSVLDARLSYYEALEEEYETELNIIKAKREEGYARQVDVKSVNVKLDNMRIEKSSLQNELTYMRSKVEGNSGVILDKIDYAQVPENLLYSAETILEGFLSSGTYTAYNRHLAEAYSSYISHLTGILDEIKGNPLSQITVEIEPIEDYILDEQELIQYLEGEISNYEAEMQICGLRNTQYEINISLYADKLYHVIVQYLAQHQAIQAELDVLNSQRAVQVALYEGGLSRQYEIFQYDTKIKEKEYQSTQVIYQLMRIVYIIDNHIENQEI